MERDTFFDRQFISNAGFADKRGQVTERMERASKEPEETQVPVKIVFEDNSLDQEAVEKSLIAQGDTILDLEERGMLAGIVVANNQVIIVASDSKDYPIGEDGTLKSRKEVAQDLGKQLVASLTQEQKQALALSALAENRMTFEESQSRREIWVPNRNRSRLILPKGARRQKNKVNKQKRKQGAKARRRK